jgi:two-component system NtrC family sensor kinase
MSGRMAADIEQLRQLNDKLVRTEKTGGDGNPRRRCRSRGKQPARINFVAHPNDPVSRQSDEDTRDKLKLISTQISRISQVTKDMTDFARARSSAREPVDVNSIILTSLRLASFDESFSLLKVQTNLGENLKWINADIDQLQQVFLNLFLNARDAMPNGGSLFIESSETEKECVVAIRDSGTGIDRGVLNQIFDPFFTTKPTGKGTGLGLAVCYGIVTAYGGTIEAESNNGREPTLR